ncbi:flagellar biosynthetic protein FliO [Terracoccus sp. 273MFTsu3.1]|uniref:flagellar biosynthetic protein FliO n=1 Tax=Terracoccus sp. 273MFTsu3.1 TaxID=1172188 RepID=UPI0003708AC0|nr:flagellar biosynthetic protein FliO [Terracoccus sp. 273MFTsu3.1]
MDSLILGLRVLVSLGAVFGLMWLIQHRLRAGNPGLRAKLLSVVARQTVGPKASVVLVDTDGKRFLLGVTEHGISVLHTADVPVAESGLELTAPPSVPGAVPDPTHDAVPGDPGTLATQATSSADPAMATRRSVRKASFEAELRKQTEAQGAAGTRPTGSILEPATWRLAADALRSGRRS